VYYLLLIEYNVEIQLGGKDGRSRRETETRAELVQVRVYVRVSVWVRMYASVCAVTVLNV